jgi:hypothetical protein
VLEVNAKVSRQTKAEMGSIQSIGCSPVTEEPSRINRPKAAIISMGEIGNHDMAVKMRVTRTADSMRKPSGRHSLDAKHVSFLRDGICSLDTEGSLLKVAKCHLKCFMVHVHHCSSLIMVRRGKKNADTLWGGKDCVVANTASPMAWHQCASRWSAVQDARKIVGVDFS